MLHFCFLEHQNLRLKLFTNKKAVLSQGGPRDAVVNFDRYVSKFTAALRGFHCESTAFE